MRAEASSATILQAGPLVRVQQGEPRRSKVRFAPILFFRKNKTIRTLPCSSSFRKKTQDVFCESSSETNDTAVPRWARSRPPPEAEEGRRRALSKREDFDREGERRPFCKLDESRKKRGDGKPTAAGGGGREAKGA